MNLLAFFTSAASLLLVTGAHAAPTCPSPVAIAQPAPILPAGGHTVVRVGNGVVVFRRLADGSTASRFHPNMVRTDVPNLRRVA